MIDSHIPPKPLSLIQIFLGKSYRFMNRYYWKVLIQKKLRNYLRIHQGGDTDWWNNEYVKEFHHHSFQNKIISNDFLDSIGNNKSFLELFSSSKRFVDLGSGTGELAHFASKRFQYQKILGLEVSGKAVEIANELYRDEVIEFRTIKPEEQLDNYGKFDFVICSNTLEHFQKPEIIIDKAFNLSDIFIALIPYRQPVSDVYEYEGGPGHVNTFDENSFSGYELIDYTIFRTGGWQTSTGGEDPLQLAVMLKKKSVS